MDALKKELNELIDQYGLRHKKVIACSTRLDDVVLPEQIENLRKIEKYKDFKLTRC